MGARLLQLDGGRTVAAMELTKRPLAIGRDEECEWVVERGRVSGRHVLIEWSNGRGVLQDLGSTNGTTLNGRNVEGATEIRAGDLVELAGEVAFLVESTDVAGWVRALLWLVLLLLVGGAAFVYTRRDDLYWRFAPRWNANLRQAQELGHDAVAAAERGEGAAAQSKIRQAVWVLDHNGFLDDVKRRETFNVGLERVARLIGTDRDLHEFIEEVSVAAEPPVGSGPNERPGCRLDDRSRSGLRPCLGQYVRFYIRELRQKDDTIPGWFVDQVGERLKVEHDSIQFALSRGTDYFPMMRSALEERHMPPLLLYLAGAESAYKNAALSPKAAAGLWQFIPDTARRYQLVVDNKVDERTDPHKATGAAAEYLRDLAFEFGGDSLLLAMAGYNRGEDGVRAALRKLEDPFADRSYWTLCEKKLLPQETRDYAARIFAYAVAGEGGMPDKAALESAGF